MSSWKLKNTIYYIYIDLVGNQISNKKYLLIRVIKNKIKGSWKEYVMRMNFKLWQMINVFGKPWGNKSLIMNCSQNNGE